MAYRTKPSCHKLRARLAARLGYLAAWLAQLPAIEPSHGNTNYWWLEVTQKVNDYISGCDKCQQMKSFPEKPAEKLKPNKSTIAPWKNITTDFVTGLPKAQKYDALFVTCCRHTKQAHIILTHSTVMAQGLATLFRNNVWKLHGLLDMALSDWGPQFAAEFMWELNNNPGNPN